MDSLHIWAYIYFEIPVRKLSESTIVSAQKLLFNNEL